MNTLLLSGYVSVARILRLIRINYYYYPEGGGSDYHSWLPEKFLLFPNSTSIVWWFSSGPTSAGTPSHQYIKFTQKVVPWEPELSLIVSVAIYFTRLRQWSSLTQYKTTFISIGPNTNINRLEGVK